MNNRLKSLVLFCAALMILTVLGTVILVNMRAYERRENARREAQAREKAALEAQDPYGKVAVGSAGEGFAGTGLQAGRDPEDASYYAYRNDETFFDKELSSYEKLLRDNEKRLSFLATSIQRDLRVQIMDELGRPAVGKDLFITLNDVEYKDLDRDGIIYVGDLSPGDYQVALKETEGYKVPSHPVSIHVKENVEFYPIEDISLLLKTEDDIDVEAEDSEEALGGDDSDESQQSSIISPGESRSFGIDVSKWNGEIDWTRVKNAGVTFAIIRCGYRGSKTGALIEDPRFRENLRGAKSAGIKVGLYFFTQAVNAVEAVEEASAVLNLNGGGSLDMPIFIDSEGAGGNGRADRLDANRRTEVVQAFCETIENSGYRSGVYASRSWLYNNLDMKVLDPYVVWLAEYRDSPKYTGKFHMWQYTDKGRLDGINTNVDFNLAYGEVK